MRNVKKDQTGCVREERSWILEGPPAVHDTEKAHMKFTGEQPS